MYKYFVVFGILMCALFFSIIFFKDNSNSSAVDRDDASHITAETTNSHDIPVDNLEYVNCNLINLNINHDTMITQSTVIPRASAFAVLDDNGVVYIYSIKDNKATLVRTIKNENIVDIIGVKDGIIYHKEEYATKISIIYYNIKTGKKRIVVQYTGEFTTITISDSEGDKIIILRKDNYKTHDDAVGHIYMYPFLAQDSNFVFSTGYEHSIYKKDYDGIYTINFTYGWDENNQGVYLYARIAPTEGVLHRSVIRVNTSGQVDTLVYNLPHIIGIVDEVVLLPDRHLTLKRRKELLNANDIYIDIFSESDHVQKLSFDLSKYYGSHSNEVNIVTITSDKKYLIYQEQKKQFDTSKLYPVYIWDGKTEPKLIGEAELITSISGWLNNHCMLLTVATDKLSKDKSGYLTDSMQFYLLQIDK